jgi:hypothetical protein
MVDNQKRKPTVSAGVVAALDARVPATYTTPAEAARHSKW